MGKAFLYGVGGGSGGGGALQDKTTALDMSQGDQEIVADAGYDGLSKAKVTRPASFIAENIKKDVVIGGITGTYEGTAIANTLDDLVDGTITTFTMPQGKTKVKQYLFRDNTALTYANLQGATNIEQYAFYGCTNAEIILPSTLTTIGQYAFYSAGKSTALMELSCPSICTIGQNAFYSAKIKKVIGKISSIGGYSFQNSTIQQVDITDCGSISDSVFRNSTTLTKVHIITQQPLSISSFVFNGCYNVNDFLFSAKVTALSGTSTFQAMGRDRQSPESNVFVFDLRTSTFTSTGTQTFTLGKYWDVYLPETLTTIGSSSFSSCSNCNIYFTRETPATIQSNTFQYISNTTLWVPYNSVNAYRTAANWNASAVSSAIKGYAAENTFTTGQTLPTYNNEGYGLTWYSDAAMTTQVTTVADATQRLYCVVGTTVIAYRIKSVLQYNCTVNITDGTNTYSFGDMVPTGSVLTISGVPSTTGWIPYLFEVNGNSFVSGDTLTVLSDVSIKALYYDGQNAPFDSTFGNNSWEQIMMAGKFDLAKTLWQVGDTVIDSNNRTWQIVDMKNARYQLADGSGYTNIVVMQVPVFDNGTNWVKSSDTENYSQSLINEKLSTGGAYYLITDQSLRTLVDQNKIIIKASQYNTSATVDCVVGMFIPAYNEVGYTNTYGYGSTSETICNGATMGSFEYFANNNTNANRIKRNSQNTAKTWQSRSRYSSSYSICIDTNGAASRYGALRTPYAVAPCVAF